MLPVYLSISGNFRKGQVKNIAGYHWRQARKSLEHPGLVIQNLSIRKYFPSAVVLTSAVLAR